MGECSGNLSLVLFCHACVSPLLCSKYFLQVFGVAQSYCDREELRAPSLLQSIRSAGQGWQEAAAAQNVSESQQKVQ